MKLKDMDQVEAWSSGVMLPVGWHLVTVDEAEEGTSSGQHPQLELAFTGNEGSIRDWLVDTEAARGKIKSMLEAAGIEIGGGDWELDPSSLVGRKLEIYVGEEPDRDDPAKMRRRVKAYRPPQGGNGSSGGAVSGQPDLPF